METRCRNHLGSRGAHPFKMDAPDAGRPKRSLFFFILFLPARCAGFLRAPLVTSSLIFKLWGIFVSFSICRTEKLPLIVTFLPKFSYVTIRLPQVMRYALMHL